MIPFSFENITRTAGLDTTSAFPVSDAARATHESFKSHLQRAAASAIDPPARRAAPQDETREQAASKSNEPLRNEPVRRDADEAQRDDADVREADTLAATTAAETPAERNDEDTLQDAAPEEEVVIAATVQEPRATSEVLELEAAGDLDDESKPAIVSNRTDPSRDARQNELDTSLVPNAGEPVDEDIVRAGEDAPEGREVERVGGKVAEPVEPKARTHRVKPSDTDQDAADAELDEATQTAEATSQDDEPSTVRTTQQRRGNRGDLAVKQPANEPPDAATKAVAIDVAETTVDTDSDDGSRQRHNGKATNATQPIGNATGGDSTTATQNAPSRFAQHLLTKSDDSAARGPSITDADQARFVDRVARAVQATGERGGTLRLRLSPPELGALTLEVKVQRGVVSARVEADTPAARSLLLENLPVLRERLAEFGMRVDHFDVDLSDRHAGGTSDGMQQNDQQHEDRPRAKATAKEPDEAQAISSDTPLKKGKEQLNIIV